MTTSVKMTAESKRDLDRLRENLSRIEGRALTAQEILAALVRVGKSNRDAVLEELSQIRYPLPASRVKAILSIAGDFGETSEDDIDATLYGGRKRRRS